ncbi:MAG TPA: hypothetical protein ENG88_00485, partial [Nitrospirae bacterium]|nr:hypothetical protein [Nitrospirota bacterium]
MRNNSFSKTIIFSFLLLGLLLGVLPVAAMGESGKQYLMGAVMLLFVAAFVIAARLYLSKQKRVSGTIQESKEGS